MFDKKAYQKEYRQRNLDKRRIEYKIYREKNKEKFKKYNKEYREKNRNKIKKHMKVWYQNNKDKIKEKSKMDWQKNKEKRKIQRKEYRIKNQDVIKKNKHKWNYNKRWILECIPFKLFWKQIDKEKRDKEKRKKKNQASKNWRSKNKEHRKQYDKIHGAIYYKKNKDRLLIQRKEYRQRTPQKQLKRMIRHLEKYAIPFELSIKQYKYALLDWSKTIKKTSGNCCAVCGSTDKLHSHHILHKAKYPELSLNVNNGIPLCKQHHDEVHLKNLICA